MFRQTVALTLFAVALPVAAQTAVDPATGASPVAKPEKRFCRRMEETGSIMGGKSVCHTKKEWAAIDSANGSNIAASRDIRGGAGSPRGN